MNVNAIMKIRQIDKIRFVYFSWLTGILNNFWKKSSNWQNTNCLHFMICRNYQQLSGEKICRILRILSIWRLFSRILENCFRIPKVYQLLERFVKFVYFFPNFRQIFSVLESRQIDKIRLIYFGTMQFHVLF